MTTSLKIAAASLLALTVAGAGYAFDLPKMPGQSQGNAAQNSSPTAASVARDARDTIFSLTRAQQGMLQALGGSDALAAQKQTLEGLSKGDAAVKQDDIQTAVSLSQAAQEELKKKLAENAQLSAENKQLALHSSVDYLNGLIAGQHLLSSIQQVAKNPVAMGKDAGTVMYVMKQLPDILVTGTSTSGLFLKYLAANGVDTSEARKAAQSLGT